MNVQIKSIQPASKHGISSGLTVLPGEDEAAYHDFLSRVYAAVKPIDIIDEMFISDVAALEWEILRWRRLKLSLMRACAVTAIEEYFSKPLDYKHYWKFYEEDLTEILQNNHQTKEIAQTLAHQCAWNEPEAIDKVERFLTAINRNVDDILDSAQARKAKELAQEYSRGKSRAIKLVDKLLAVAGLSIDAIMAEPLSEELDNIERIDRLATIAETRRNAALREIDRRRAVLGERLRRHVQEVEGEVIDEGEVIEKTPAEAKSAA